MEDTLAARFVEAFYQNVARWPRDEALRQTQLMFLRGRVPAPAGLPVEHPLFWAGFQLYGDPGRLSLT